jgi:hypothetical protein
VHELRSGSHQAGKPGGVDGDLEGLLPVDLDHGDPDPVLQLELLVGLDVDLLEFEPETLPLRQDRLAGNVAEMTSRA